MTAPERDEFYVGYLDRAPSGLARRMKAVVWMLAPGAAALFAVLAAGQNPQPSGRFEFGNDREFEGVLYTSPLPYVRVVGPGRSSGNALILVESGKQGVSAELERHDGQRIRFSGSLIYRENLTMVEIRDLEAVEVLGPPGPGQARDRHEVVGPVELTGELVDTKCFLGVMRPATGKVHKACAVRCLKGGIPPGILVRDAAGDATVFMLVGTDGGPLPFDLEMAAREIRVEGLLEIHDGLPVLRTRRVRPV